VATLRAKVAALSPVTVLSAHISAAGRATIRDHSRHGYGAEERHVDALYVAVSAVVGQTEWLAARQRQAVEVTAREVAAETARYEARRAEILGRLGVSS